MLFRSIHKRVANLNNKLADKLTEAELLNTIMVTISKALAKRAA